MTGRLLAVATIGAILFVVLGVVLGSWVTHQPLARIDLESAAVRGNGDPLAIVLTNSGYGFALTCLGIGTIVAALVLHAPITIPIGILISQLASQGMVNVMKGAFGRPRPDRWLYRREFGLSYPSGHATTAIVFYGSWLVVACLSPLPPFVRIAGAGLLGVWILGIGWSRVALGAHYPTDVIGGYLFGAAWLCATIALAVWRQMALAARPA